MAKSTPKRKIASRGAKRAKAPAVFDAAALREIALQFPDVEDASTDRGIAFKARGRLLTCAAIHASAEPGSLVVRISLEERPRLIAAHPRALYLTDHYVKHPAVLARPAQLDAAALRDILGAAWLYVTEKAVGPKRRSRRKR
jgi:hypothetical protein